MKIYYREKSGGIEILRCLGIESRVEIPEMIDEKMVISAAPYAFSSHMDETEELKDARCLGDGRWIWIWQGRACSGRK